MITFCEDKLDATVNEREFGGWRWETGNEATFGCQARKPDLRGGPIEGS